MKANIMAIIHEADKLPKQEPAARAQIWTNTAQLLLPGLGKLYSKFYPATRAWGKTVGDPLGVILGACTPEKLIAFYIEASQAQRRAVEFHLTPLLDGIDPEKLVRAGDALICPVSVDMEDKAVSSHAIWHLSIMNGALLPDCGVYHASKSSAVVSPEDSRSIIGNAANYAMCLVAVEPMEVQDGGAV